MSGAWARGSTRRWRRLRALVLLRDGYRCRIALQGTWVTTRGQTRQCLGRADTVHHTLGRGTTGDDPRYLVAACTPCNLKVGQPERQPDPPHRSLTRW